MFEQDVLFSCYCWWLHENKIEQEEDGGESTKAALRLIEQKIEQEQEEEDGGGLCSERESEWNGYWMSEGKVDYDTWKDKVKVKVWFYIRHFPPNDVKKNIQSFYSYYENATAFFSLHSNNPLM